MSNEPKPGRISPVLLQKSGPWRRYGPFLAILVLVLSGTLVLWLNAVQVTADSGGPSVRHGEWVIIEALSEPPRMGSLVLVECSDGGHAPARVVGYPGERLTVSGESICRSGDCLPTASLLLKPADKPSIEAAVEVVGGRSHLILPAQGAKADSWRGALPVTIPADRIGVLPDNRASVDFGHCTGGTIALPRDRIVGGIGPVLYSRDWSRIGVNPE